MELLGPNVHDLLNMCGAAFSLKTAIQVAVEMIDRVQLIHSLGMSFVNQAILYYQLLLFI